MDYLCTMFDLCTEKELFIFEKIAGVARALSFESYVIGGFVRDKILGRTCKDIDIVCVGDGPLLAEHTARVLGDNIHVNIFKNFGTAHLRYEDLDIEFVGARKESYRSDSRKPEVEQGSLQDDQSRRDFTINALAFSLNENNYGQLIDPFNGIRHLEQQLIITPLEPETTFSDDPLRMLRAIRFAAQLQFHIEPYTLASIAEQAHRIKIISKERVCDELNKIVLSPKPSIGFDLLEKTGLLKLIFPQMQDLKGVEVLAGKGHKDNFYHTLQVLDNVAAVSNKLWLRWAAILHDIAKPATKQFEKGHGWTFHGHEFVGAKMVPRIFANLKLPLHEDMRYVQKLVLLHLRPISLTKAEITDSAIRRLLFDAGEDLEDLMVLCNADVTSKDANKVKRIRDNFELVKQKLKDVEERDKIRNWQPPISGELIMETFQLSPSKVVGDIKTIIRESILDGNIQNNFEEAFALMLRLGEERGLVAVNK